MSFIWWKIQAFADSGLLFTFIFPLSVFLPWLSGFGVSFDCWYKDLRMSYNRFLVHFVLVCNAFQNLITSPTLSTKLFMQMRTVQRLADLLGVIPLPSYFFPYSVWQSLSSRVEDEVKGPRCVLQMSTPRYKSTNFYQFASKCGLSTDTEFADIIIYRRVILVRFDFKPVIVLFHRMY